MAASKTFRHQEYELQCSARVIDSGNFVPELVVAKLAWPRRPRVIAMQRGDFATADAAIDAAYAQGVEWILNYG